MENSTEHFQTTSTVEIDQTSSDVDISDLVHVDMSTIDPDTFMESIHDLDISSPPRSTTRATTPVVSSPCNHDDENEPNTSKGDSGIFSSPEANSEEHERRLRARHPKPEEPYVKLIAKAIMNSPDGKVALAEIYGFIADQSPYYRLTRSAWKNGVRHNLSVNECFIKSGRARNGRGFYWTIHPACLQNFKDGEFNRRVARVSVQQFLRRAEHARAQAQTSAFQPYYSPQPTPHLQAPEPPYNYFPGQMSSTPLRRNQPDNLPYLHQPEALPLDPTWQHYSYPNNHPGSYS